MYSLLSKVFHRCLGLLEEDKFKDHEVLEAIRMEAELLASQGTSVDDERIDD